ncbi:hypothetical protein OROGR_006453 [Orobanche gracilis]
MQEWIRLTRIPSSKFCPLLARALLQLKHMQHEGFVCVKVPKSLSLIDQPVNLNERRNPPNPNADQPNEGEGNQNASPNLNEGEGDQNVDQPNEDQARNLNEDLNDNEDQIAVKHVPTRGRVLKMEFMLNESNLALTNLMGNDLSTLAPPQIFDINILPPLRIRSDTDIGDVITWAAPFGYVDSELISLLDKIENLRSYSEAINGVKDISSGAAA